MNKTFTKFALAASASILVPLAFAAPAFASTTYPATDQASLVSDLATATSGDTIILDNGFNVTSEISVNTSGVTIDGNGQTLTPTFSKTTNSNNSTFGIYGNDVTVKNLTIDGTGGTSLHGINVYEATGVHLNNVTLENNGHYGLEVNGSTVTVSNITTAHNGWGGVDVDQGGGVTSPAVLTVNGVSHHNEVAGKDLYIDNTSKNVSVVDTNSQYNTTDGVWNINPDDRVYTLIDPAPVVSINNPVDGSTVYGTVDVHGTVTDNNPDHYYLVIKNSGGTVVAGPGTVHDTASFTDQSLYSWDTSSFADGTYTVFLAARDAAGNREAGSQDSVVVTVNNTPDNKNECKKGGWQNFTNPTFKNQGQCVSYIQANGHAGKK
jgi:hypothetical protein